MIATPPDQAERDRAISPSMSFIVQAPAGSGKTELLIQRYLRLLACVDEPEQVLAITFTRKASGEMRSRVIGAIQQAASGNSPPEPHLRKSFDLAREILRDSRRQGWLLDRHDARLNISTIDSVNAWIAGCAPLSAGSATAPFVADTPDHLYVEAARATLELLGDEDSVAAPVAALLAHLDDDARRFEKMVVAMLPRRDQWLRHVMAPESDRSLHEAAMRASRARPMLTSGTAGDWRKQVNIRQGFAPKTPAKERMEAILRELRGRDELRDQLREVRRLPGGAYSASQWAMLRTLIEVLRLAAAQLRVLFGARGEVDFPEVASAAMEALGSDEQPSDLGLILDNRIRHILVDEFQDISLAQFDFLRRLTAGWIPDDGRTLFLVGDPMQSIYRFREAEVGLFMRVRDHGIGGIRPQFLRLTTNFRSLPEVVSWNNRVIGRAFPSCDDPILGAVAYAPSRPFLRSTATVGSSGVRCHWLPSAEPSAEADKVLEIVGDISRPSGIESVCILVRSRSHAGAIMDALRARRIPFSAPDMENMERANAAQDLLALTRALMNPADRLAWIGLLRSPLCGLTLQELDALLAADHRRDVPALIRLGFESAGFSTAGAQAATRLLAVMQRVRCAWGRVAIRELVEGAWLELGGPATLQDEAELKTAMTFLQILESMDRDPEGLDPLALGAELSRRSGSLGGGASGVQIMTMHKAKGLEFDTVILPGLGKSPRAADAPLLLWHDMPAGEDEQGLVLAPIGPSGMDGDPLYDYLWHVERRKQRQENNRLLYVACTRARRQLHLIAHVAFQAETGEKALSLRRPPAGSLLAQVWPALADEARAQTTPALAEPGEQGRSPVWIQPVARRLPLNWSRPAVSGPVPVRASASMGGRRELLQYEWASNWAMHAGAVVHRWLQAIAERGGDGFDADRIEQLEPEFQRMLAQLGTPAQDMRNATLRVKQALRGAVCAERGQWILSDQHVDARNEWPLTIMDGERFRNIVIDRAFIDADGFRWVIDYKTSSHEGGNVQEFLRLESERHAEQLRTYRQAVAGIGSEPVRTALFFPLLGEFLEVV